MFAKNCLAKKYKNKNTYTYTKRYETTNYTVLSLLECKNFSRSIENTVRLKAASDEKSVERTKFRSTLLPKPATLLPKTATMS